jgi:hypothetical protein
VGECAVTTWAEAFVTTRSVALFRANGAGNSIFRQHNASHGQVEGRHASFAELQQMKDASRRSHVDTEACQPISIAEVALPPGLVVRPLRKVEAALTCTSRGLCRAIGRTVDGSALVQWTLLLCVAVLVGCTQLCRSLSQRIRN